MSKLPFYIEQDHIGAGTPCECGDCQYVGPVETFDEMTDGVLTPGDPVPVGRCPECESLAYVVTKETALRDAAPELLSALQHLMRYDFGDSEGAKEARAAIAKATGGAP